MKKTYFLLLMVQSIFTASFCQSVGINTDGSQPHASAALDIKSVTKGVLIPRLTTGQRNAIVSPATGLLVFDINTSSFWFKSAANWIELVDTLNNTWKRNGANTYLNNTGNVGIGTTAPSYDLHISRTDPSLGFTDEDDNHFSGSITGDSSNLIINAYRKQSFGSNEAGNLILQASNNNQTAGNVGIGTSTPALKLDVNGGIKINGELNRTSTNAANLIPLCYGYIDTDGGVLSSTGNFTVNRVDDGVYEISLTGGQFSLQDIVITSKRVGWLPALKIINTEVHYGKLTIIIFDIVTGDAVDGAFDFIVYRP